LPDFKCRRVLAFPDPVMLRVRLSTKSAGYPFIPGESIRGVGFASITTMPAFVIYQPIGIGLRFKSMTILPEIID
jgi:hypothetical protein